MGQDVTASIKTRYKGHQFRSRLEARWAAFFDMLGWSWEYEPLDYNGWIPDFAISGYKGERTAIVEVKPIRSEPNYDRYQGNGVGTSRADYDFNIAHLVPGDLDLYVNAIDKIPLRDPDEMEDYGSFPFSGDLLILGTGPTFLNYYDIENACSLGWFHHPSCSQSEDAVLTIHGSDIGLAYYSTFDDYGHELIRTDAHIGLNKVFTNRRVIEALWAAASAETQWKSKD